MLARMTRVLAILVVCAGCNGQGSSRLPGDTGSAPGPTILPGTGSGSTTGVSDLPRWNGTLAQAAERILGDLSVGRDSEGFRAGDATLMADFRDLAGRLGSGSGDITVLAAAHGYEAGIVRDEVNDRDVVVVWEPEGVTHRGALVVALGPARPVVVESPHAQFDGRTGEQGVEWFVDLQARAWIVSTAHRCANAAFSPCDGTSTVCGNGTEPYHESDAAHFELSAFQAWHEGLTDGDTELIALQNHGFAHTDPEPDSYLSIGSAQPSGPDALSTRLAEELDKVLPNGAASCQDPADAAIARFCASTNTQGRHLNGSASPCDTVPDAMSNRFLHIEQSWDLRNHDGDVNQSLMLEALKTILPPVGDRD